MRVICVAGVLAAGTWVSGNKPSAAAPAEADPGTNQVILQLRGDVAGRMNVAQQRLAVESIAARTAPALEYRRDHGDGVHTLRLNRRRSTAEMRTLAAQLAADPLVAYAEPDVILQHALAPNDSLYDDQWHYKAVDANNYGVDLPAAWEVERGDPGLVVAVIDTGYRPHADLAGRFAPGYDFVTDVMIANDGDGRDADAQDPGDWITPAESAAGYFQECRVSASSWHGTHVAGTIGAVSNNQQGVAGINWYSKILPVRALGKCGGYSSDIIDGMRWAAGLSVPGAPENPNPARVINISLGGFGACLSSFQNAIDAIVARGSIVVAAAGNQQLDASLSQPGNCQNVITVGASTRGGDLAAYSNYGLALEVSAPGGDSKAAILSTANAGTTTPGADAYLVYMGTSMAAPHVAGIVSLMLSADPCLTTTQITALLQNTLTPFHNPISCAPSRCGPGITNAGAAVAAARTGLATRTAANAVPRTTKLRPLTPFSIAVPGVFNGWSTSACYP